MLAYMSDSETFSAWLRRQRLRAKLSQREAADRAGVSRTWWYQAERGFETKQGVKTKIGHTRASTIAMARAINADVEVALRLNGYTAPTDVEARPTLTALVDVIHALAAVPVDQLREVATFLRWGLSLTSGQREHFIELAQVFPLEQLRENQQLREAADFLRWGMSLTSEQRAHIIGLAQALSTPQVTTTETISSEQIIETPQEAEDPNGVNPR